MNRNIKENDNNIEKDNRSYNKWNQARRLEFIDFRLSCDGKINRKDLVDFFSISVPQASLDLSKYQEMVENSEPPRANLKYDRHLISNRFFRMFVHRNLI